MTGNSRPLKPSPTFAKPIATTASILFAALLIGLFIQRANFNGHPPNARKADSVADWIVATEARRGGDPYQDPRALGRGLGTTYDLDRAALVEDMVDKGIHFRTPGALLILLPITAVEANAVYGTSLILNAILILLLAGLAADIVGISLRWAVFYAPLLTATTPIIQTLDWGAQSLLVAALLVGSWRILRQHDSILAGAALGFSCTLKLYPLLLLLPLLTNRRWRAAASASCVFVGSQAIGLLVFEGVTFAGSLSALRQADALWGPFPANPSLITYVVRAGLPWPGARILCLVLALTGLLWLWRRTNDFDARFAASLIVATTLSPLAWVHYDVALIIVGAWLATVARQSRLKNTLLALWAGCSLAGWLILLLVVGSSDSARPLSDLSLAGRVLLALAVLLVWSRREASDSREGALALHRDTKSNSWRQCRRGRA